LTRKDGKGITVREHLQAIQRQTGEVLDELQGEPIPPEMLYLWGIFVDLNSGRTYGMSPNPLTFTDIAAYAALTQVDFRAWEVSLIKQVDLLWLKEVVNG